MTKSLITIVVSLFLLNTTFSQADSSDIKLFDEFIGDIDLEFLTGTYNEPITYNQNTLEMGGIEFMDAGQVLISYDVGKKSGKILYHEYDREIKFTLNNESNLYKLKFESENPEIKTYNGQILALNKTTLRIIYFNRANQLQLDEFIR